MSTTLRNVSRIFANNRTDRRVDFSRKEVRGVVMGIFWTLMVTVSLVYGAVSGRLSAVTAVPLLRWSWYWSWPGRCACGPVYWN